MARSLSASASLVSGPPEALSSVSELSEVSWGVGSCRGLERAGGVGCGSSGSLEEVTWKRPTSWGFASSEMGASLASPRSGQAGFGQTSLSASGGPSWPRGAGGREGGAEGRLGKGHGRAGGDWDRRPGEGDSRDWATVITAREKALARERRGAVVEGARGDGEGLGGKESGLEVTWEAPGENGSGAPGGRELWGSGEDGAGNRGALEGNGSGEPGGCGAGLGET